jgi:small conductance mechanosensitive channel
MAIVLGERIERVAAWLDQTGWQKLQKLLVVVLTCLVILWALRLVSKAVARSMAAGMGEGNPEAQRRAKTLGEVIGNFARVLVISFFILETLQEFNVNVGPLVAGVGIVGAAIGFGAQNLVKDVIGGFFLLVENQYGVGDIISVGDKHVGTVEKMTFRVTQLRDMEGRAHFIPNGTINDVIVLSKQFAKALVDVEVSHDEDLDRIMVVLREVGAELHKDLAKVLEPTEVLGVETMTPTSCTLRTLTKCTPGDQWAVARELRRRVLIRFKLEGFGRAIPQRMIIHR